MARTAKAMSTRRSVVSRGGGQRDADGPLLGGQEPQDLVVDGGPGRGGAEDLDLHVVDEPGRAADVDGDVDGVAGLGHDQRGGQPGPQPPRSRPAARVGPA